MATRVTARDIATGEVKAREITDDYAVICDGRTYVDHVQAYSTGTHVVTIRRRSAEEGGPGGTPRG